MSQYITVVLKLPKTNDEVRYCLPCELQIGNALHGCVITGMSLEDEMTVLEMIEQHDDFDSRIADEARAKASKLHKFIETAVSVG